MDTESRLNALVEEIQRLKYENENLRSSKSQTSGPISRTEVFECPNEPSDVSLTQKRSLILCGPIYDNDNWQQKTIRKITGTDLIVFNPRRADSNGNEMDDLTWELKSFERALAVSFWISWDHPNINSTLMELGRALSTKTFVFIGIHPNNENKKSIARFIKMHSPSLSIAGSIEKLENQIKYWIVHNSLPKSNSNSSSESTTS